MPDKGARDDFAYDRVREAFADRIPEPHPLDDLDTEPGLQRQRRHRSGGEEAVKSFGFKLPTAFESRFAAAKAITGKKYQAMVREALDTYFKKLGC